ncbi:MAG: bifunctional homocysteine S-methyltransferase/methylenetetrahydrofolate reductase [Chloroflexota bacterium]|nr:bifunctional homocysteine S-methyltransferase/methylenetetrahydrofolate reductase [Chloroflexota bacterium]
MVKPFQIGSEPVLCDGAMGTLLYARGGVPFGRCFDELDLTRPDLVRSVHLDYIRAGAEIIETNTFGANAIRLSGHGLDARTAEINAAGVRLAIEARDLCGQHVWIAGAVGPLGRGLAPMGHIAPSRARAVFQEQIAALATAGADLLILETFGDLREMTEAVLAARSVCALSIIAQMAFNEDGRTLAGDSPQDVVSALEGLGVTALGANCSIGSEPMLRVIEAMAGVTHIPLSAQPNAGFPAYVSGRYVYLASPEHMADYARRMVEAGAAVVGGCCGTTHEHVSAMRDATRGLRLKSGASASSQPPPAPTTPVAVRPVVTPTRLARKLGKGFVVTLEVDPPRGFDVGGLVKRLEPLARLGYVDALDVADSPRAQARMSALALCSLLQMRLGLETILHVAIRHRNLVALHSDLLGAHALGVRNVLAVMGDPPRDGDYPEASVVADITPSGLMALLKAFNRGQGPGGARTDQPTAFTIGGAFNPNAQDPDKEQRALEKKLAAGVDFLLSQPVYDPDVVERWRQRLGGFPVPLLVGVLPLRSLRHAEFLHNEVPGIVVPEEVRRQLRAAGEDNEEAVGLALARELLVAVAPLVGGAYVIPPFGHYDVVEPLFKGLETSVLGHR